jgi:hypothetical protein
MRISVEKRLLAKILASQKMQPNTRTTPETVAPPTQDLDQAFHFLQQAVRAFNQNTGPIHASTLLCPIDKATALRLQLIHANHHFAFLAPAAS